MSTRPLQILQRFPAHFEPTRPDKQLFAVVEALSADLDVMSSDLSGVRRAHRLADADTLRDVLLIGGLHGLDRSVLDVLLLRIAAVRSLARQLLASVEAHDAATRDARAEALFRLWNTAGLPPRLPLYADPAAPADLELAARVMVGQAADSVAFPALLTAARTRVGEHCRIHAGGNATLRALLEAASNALDLDIDHARNAQIMAALREQGSVTLDLLRTDGYFHSVDRYRHVTFVRDRLQPPPLPRPSGPPFQLPYTGELVGLEENPLREFGEDVGPKPHAALFTVSRRGFSRAELQVEIGGIEDRTVGPHLVNRDEGVGVGFAGAVPDGGTLILDEDGTLLLKADPNDPGTDVTDYGFSWKGGCFGEGGASHALDFTFDGPGRPEDRRAATFAVGNPLGCIDRDAVFPHPPVPLEDIGLGVGDTRFAFFVQEAGMSLRVNAGPPPTVRRLAPYMHIGFADGSVFAAGLAPRPDAGDIRLSWLEHQAHAVRVWIPKRFAALDTADVTVKELVRRALERFRAVGVHVEVVYQEDEWILGTGVLFSPEGDPTLSFLGGTVLSPTPSP
jgi:hypothetical protein